ncbi:helix-hairpin-helix domain-containing protein [Chryseobacterium jejuense]|uniref:Competence protein ComEA helix-hairpin-helix repeat region n=1 Tax=Chryseobacterium jejuense TaxID=445960 RepID=A0A2X2ZAD3_CHRJE|nr:helix-hairpin-helix domain-containing protein [Chryseobacterium jejuense]SDI18724.1 Helix-hairpin-helix motif-containing protein [Chryseobacterium jejuense]SQB46629.1 competence protein ComEA helix-hairpin-helix repeat region [Chryseobacterium jejuense]
MMRKNYYQKLAFMVILMAILLAFQEYTSKDKEPFPDVKFIDGNSITANITDFDPNILTPERWQELGFSEKQASTILKYKDIVGGTFTSKEQLKKCYAISDEKFEELKPFILLPEASVKDNSNRFNNFERKEIIVSEKFNPDLKKAHDWSKMGFSERQAEAIIKYKNYLGGSFISKEKFRECFIISPENYSKLEPYLLLPSKTPENFKTSDTNYPKKIKVQYRAFDPNRLDVEGWKALGFSDKQAQAIVNYRDKNLRGSFKDVDDIQKCFVISAEKFQEMKPFITLNPEAIKKVEIQQEKTDFSKTDLNTITFKQLIEFGLDEKSAGSIIGFRKKLRGFVNKQQILDTYNIDKELVQKLISIAPLDASNVPKYSLADAPEEWLKDHPYFKYSADKIIFYRITYPDDKKILKFLKLKPEYEERMKLYLK